VRCSIVGRHTPRKRSTQYSRAFAIHHERSGILGRPVKPGDDVYKYCTLVPSRFPFQISNSHALTFPRRRASWAFSFSPLHEGRRSAERRALVTVGRSMFPALGKQRPRKRLPTLPRSVLRPWSVLPGTWQTPEEVLEHGVFAPLACPRPASSQWQTQLRAGRIPKASRLVLARHVPRRRISHRVAPPASSRSVPLPNAS
jgi:hypothetical protein